MRRLSVLLAGVLFLACPAWAEDAVDRIVLRDGSVIEGELLEPKDGRLWILAADGSMRSAPFEDIVRVERGGEVFEEPAEPPALAPAEPAAATTSQAPEPAHGPQAPANLRRVRDEQSNAPETAEPADAAEPPEATEPAEVAAEDTAAEDTAAEDLAAGAASTTVEEPETSAPGRRGLGFGVDLGVSTGARMRLNVSSPALAYVDLRVGLAPLLSLGGVKGGVLAIPQVGLFGGRPVHLVIGTPLGFTEDTGESYVGVLVGADFDPRGAIHFDVGATYGLLGGELALGPVAGVGWAW